MNQSVGGKQVCEVGELGEVEALSAAVGSAVQARAAQERGVEPVEHGGQDGVGWRIGHLGNVSGLGGDPRSQTVGLGV